MNPVLSEWAALAHIERLHQDAQRVSLLRAARVAKPQVSWLTALKRRLLRPRPSAPVSS